ncbi:cyanocobalamin reductase / alkylcobalamin dealkylase [Gadus macrocephalus]|uniref:cyanocobalamin reductase / alkylcobalamin dealkylase n=1 Tax=Gadus macrocephalus TaxID=80720 RepID=UPI0028CB8CDA|nr:cyanocobalamin reductase / alkylcobalamin dealkylase [Gadus macrocephalus]
MASPTVNFETVTRLLDDSISNLGFESHPLKIGWYNDVLPASLRQPHHEDTLAVVVLSTPDMFERAFLPFMEKGCCQGVSDPIDQCVKHTINSAISQSFPGKKVEVSYDYEMLPASRKPKFLAQTAAHVAGAAYYYQEADVTDHPWGDKKKFGVCIHPRFGGWFAIRALLVFEGVQVGCEVLQRSPPDCVPSREARIQLLEDFNLRWQDWKYRDIIPPVQRYSQRQRDYFSTRPAQRPALLQEWGFLQKEEGGSQLEPPASGSPIPHSGHG